VSIRVSGRKSAHAARNSGREQAFTRFRAHGASPMREQLLHFKHLNSALAVLREVARGFSDWLTWRTRIGLQYALLEATVGKLHNMPLRMQRSVRC
jgi:ATP-binding cassette subfamily B protein